MIRLIVPVLLLSAVIGGSAALAQNDSGFSQTCYGPGNPDQTIKELVAIKMAELGENIIIRRFTRYLVGEPLSTDDSAPAAAPAE